MFRTELHGHSGVGCTNPSSNLSKRSSSSRGLAGVRSLNSSCRSRLIEKLPELQQADRVCFLLDGAKLASKERRPAYARQFKQMIHALHDNGALAYAKHVEVLATKFDLTRTRGNTEDHIKFLGSYERQIIAEFKEHGLEITCHRVCALPKTDDTIGFLGLEDMVKRWTAAEPLPSVAPVPIRDAARQIDRLLARITGQVRARLVVVGLVRQKQMAKVPFAKHDDMVDAFPTDRADEPFDVGVLPRRARRGRAISDAERPKAPGHDLTINAISITNDQRACRGIAA